MSDQQPEVVIVGDDGTEHVFPPGFDPKRAATIVASSNPATVASLGDQIVPPGGAQREPDTFAGGFLRSIKNQILGATAGNSMVQGAAHPQEPRDFLALALPNAEAALTPVSRTIGEIGPQAQGMLRAGTEGVQQGTILKAPANFIRGMARYHNDSGRVAANRWGIDRFAPNTGGAAPAADAATTQHVPYGAAEVPPPTAAAPSPAVPPLEAGKTPTPRAILEKQGYPASVIDAYERQFQPVASHAPSARAAKFAEQQQGSQELESLLNHIHGGEENVPYVPNGGVQPPAHPLKQPRIEIGAQRVGQQQGMSKEAVRTETGPVLDEAVGEASPILPQKALNSIIDTMKQLPPGAEREAYVARATSGKAKWQIENIRRTLEHLGLLAPLGVNPVREQLLQMMRSRSGDTQG